MQNIKHTILLIFTTILFFISCEDDANKNHKIEPGKQSIEGPDSIYGSPDIKNEFVALARSGSTYKWKVENSNVPIIIEQDKLSPYKVNVIADNVTAVDSATISVVETTSDNKVSQVGTKTFRIVKYCDFNIASFVGHYTAINSISKDTEAPHLETTKVNDSTVRINSFAYIKNVNLDIVIRNDSKRSIRIIDKSFYVANDDRNEYTYKGTGKYNSCTGHIELVVLYYFNGSIKETFTLILDKFKL